MKNGRPPSWRFNAEKSTDWTVEERERVFDALEETPSFVKNLEIDSIYRMKESRSPENPAAANGATIVLYDKAFDTSQNLTHILNHEIAHRLFETLPSKERESFRVAAKWIEKRTNGEVSYVAGRPESKFMRPNGKISVEEDFADGVAFFIHQPSRLKATSPEVFQWMEQNLKPKLDNRGRK